MELKTIMHRIHKIVCRELNVNYYTTFTKTRKREIVYARHLTMTLTREFNKKESLQNIADFFEKDHATVLHSEKTVENLCDTNANVKAKFNEIKEKVELMLLIVENEESTNENTKLPIILYGKDKNGNKYYPNEINCKIDNEGHILFETKQLFGFENVSYKLNPVFDV